MFDERAIQFWCEDMIEMGEDYPFNLTPADDTHWDEFEEGCKKDSDCDGDDQQCTNIYWMGTDDSQNWSNGSACYSWDEQVCPNKDADGYEMQWGSVNENYDGTEFSYYT